jgi:triacylglycerol esterase/lipase EstA (alpha/beta hydrolase family)
MKNIPIFLFHGTYVKSWSTIPILLYLNNKGYNNVIIFNIPLDELPINDIIENINEKISNIIENKEREIIIIGISSGGLIGKLFTERTEWNVKKLITVCSPLKKPRLLKMCDYLPSLIKNYFKTPLMEELRTLNIEWKNEVDELNITTTIMPYFNYDILLFNDECISLKKNEKQIKYSNHYTFFLKNEFYSIIEEFIND